MAIPARGGAGIKKGEKMYFGNCMNGESQVLLRSVKF